MTTRAFLGKLKIKRKKRAPESEVPDKKLDAEKKRDRLMAANVLQENDKQVEKEDTRTPPEKKDADKVNKLEDEFTI